MLVRDVLKCTC